MTSRLTLALILALSLAIVQVAPAQVAGRGPTTASSLKDGTKKSWPKLTVDEQAAAVAALKAYADKATKKLNLPLELSETQYFLFYTDLPPQEARNWALLLDRMYARLADLFGVKKGDNIWRGKALIFVFAKANDFRRYERDVEKHNPGFAAGLCHAVSDGTVRISFYKQDRDLSFAHILVHESLHGFLHRYRSPTSIPSWANEGLAEAIATELVPDAARPNDKNAAKDALRKHGNALGEFFTTRQIEEWQYPIAESLAAFMIIQSKLNYVAFINAIKDGQDWEKALSLYYKAPVDRLLPAYGAWLGVKGIKQ